MKRGMTTERARARWYCCLALALAPPRPPLSPEAYTPTRQQGTRPLHFAQTGRGQRAVCRRVAPTDGRPLVLRWRWRWRWSCSKGRRPPAVALRSLPWLTLSNPILQALTPPATAVACRGWAHPRELPPLGWPPGRPGSTVPGRQGALQGTRLPPLQRCMPPVAATNIELRSEAVATRAWSSCHWLQKGGGCVPPPQTGTQGRKAWSTSAAAAQKAAADEGWPLVSNRQHIGRHNTPEPFGLGAFAAAQAASLLHSSGNEKLNRAHAASGQAPYTLLQQAGKAQSQAGYRAAKHAAMQRTLHLPEQTPTRPAGQNHS